MKSKQTQQIIDNYAHDYRNMALDYDHLRAMLMEMVESITPKKKSKEIKEIKFEEIEELEGTDVGIGIVYGAEGERINALIRNQKKLQDTINLLIKNKK